ncbi:MAG: aminoacyl-histidine dipeptidase [Alistipes onderdonkii]
MDKNLSALKPALVWKHFAQIVRIPRPSSHEEKIRKYVMDFAKSRGLECKEDAAHNVYVRKPASKGMEDRKGVILQAHLDMVPQKNNDKKFDFTKDPIDAYVDGEWVTADGTTLGADNGIGAAAILAVLEDDTLVHGPLEALFTATEETGMDGAFGLKKGLLRGDILLNLDSETEGELYVGCAGGLDANVTFKYTAEKTPARNYTAAKITVKGLKGGHSGIQIGCQRANANKVLFRFLNAASASCDVLLCSVDGGGLRNAIPREAEAVVMVKTKEYEAFAKELKAYEKVVRAEYAGIEDAVSVKIRECEAPAEMVAREVAEKLTKGCGRLPRRRAEDVDGHAGAGADFEQPRTRVVSDGKTVKLQCLLRSSVNTEKAALGEAIAAVFSLAGAKVQLSGSYDGWNPDMDSPILKAMTASYKALYGKQPAVTAIHAGLECGIIGSKYPKMDMISFGPTICYPHSPDEKVEIASVEQVLRVHGRHAAQHPQKVACFGSRKGQMVRHRQSRGRRRPRA